MDEEKENQENLCYNDDNNLWVMQPDFTTE